MRRSLIVIIIFILILLLANLSVEAAGLLYRIPVTGEIDPGLVKLVSRGIREAEETGADLILLEIDTYGGLVDSAIRIKDMIFNTRIPIVSFVSGRAWSAGALITLAAEKVAMKVGSSIGAAETRPKEEKYISALRKEFKATAEKRNKNPELVAAMVDADIEIEGITSKGKLVTLTAGEALEYNVADYEVDNLEELYAELDFKPMRVIKVVPTAAERMARIVTRPAISAILLTIGFIAIIFEALAPGWGIGGTVGLITLGLFFSGYIINGIAGWGLVILFLVGLILIALEIFIVPGFGVTGIGGLIAILTSLYFLFPTPQVAITVLATVLLFSVVGAVVIIKFFGGSRFWKRISLKTSQTREAGYVAQHNRQELLGKKGPAVTPLRPAGIVEIDGRRVDVVSEGGFIDQGKMVEIIKIAGNRIVVKPITEEDD
ncbi:MAG: hypothetical protein PWR10_1375 [Halanaerobiales bacterium]|nr:hypothetical protein [Halanaerobiales bacterium]